MKDLSNFELKSFFVVLRIATALFKLVFFNGHIYIILYGCV